MGMLARREPLLLLPDLAWPGPIPAEYPAAAAAPVVAVLSAAVSPPVSAATTGPIDLVGAQTVRVPSGSAGRAEADFPAGQRAC
jgi:hypothetical protein